MKNYSVKATRVFKDSIDNVYRNINDEFECTKERYEFLLENGAVELIEIKINVNVKMDNEKIKENVVEYKKETKKSKKK